MKCVTHLRYSGEEKKVKNYYFVSYIQVIPLGKKFLTLSAFRKEPGIQTPRAFIIIIHCRDRMLDPGNCILYAKKNNDIIPNIFLFCCFCSLLSFGLGKRKTFPLYYFLSLVFFWIGKRNKLDCDQICHNVSTILPTLLESFIPLSRKQMSFF